MNKEITSGKTFPLLKGRGLPDFVTITPCEVDRSIPLLITSLNDDLSNLENSLNEKLINGKNIEWSEIMDPLYKIGESLRWSWSAVNHLNGVCNSPELRDSHTKHQPAIVGFSNRIGQSKILYDSLLNLKNNSFKLLNQTESRILEAEILSMNNRGVGLKGIVQKDFNEDSERLAYLSTKFSNNVLDATKEWSLLLTEKDEIDGLPERAIERMALLAKEEDINKNNKKSNSKDNGPWRLGLDMPSYIPFMTYSNNRSLRERAYRAFVSRASNGELNNQPIIIEILNIRDKQAKRLGYKNWAELSLSSKMAKSIDSVEDLLESLRLPAFNSAIDEIKVLQDFAAKKEGKDSYDLYPWDIAFWSEKLKQEKFDLNQEELRPWFPLPKVLEGLFNLCEDLFEIRIEEANGEAPIWHEDVKFFKVIDKNNSNIAAFYLDPFSRPATKRGGAWMDDCLSRSKQDNGETILPVAYLICNQTPPGEDIPSLMSFEEVETLFHEFGHGLQHMLTTVDYPQASGINNIEWDAVELPSQFMENWCLDKNTFKKIANHWKTGEPLDVKTYEKLCKSKTFNSGLATLRQVHFALTDLKLHSTFDQEKIKDPDSIRRNIAKTTTVIQPIPEDKFLCAFSHIFAGGYSAGYYSYKWAEVLSADAFSAFEEVGLNNINEVKKVGRKFRETVLSLGGSKSPSEVFESFRGRPANTKALIKYSGLENSTY